MVMPVFYLASASASLAVFIYMILSGRRLYKEIINEAKEPEIDPDYVSALQELDNEFPGVRKINHYE